MGKGISQVAVIGHYQKTCGVVIKTSHRKQPLRNVRNKIRHRGSLLVILHCGNVSQRLVYNNVNLSGAGCINRLAVYHNLVALFHLGAHLRYHAAVYLHISVYNELVSLSS